MEHQPEFRQMITVCGKARRRRFSREQVRRWLRDDFPRPCPAMVIGKRTISDSSIHHEDFGDFVNTFATPLQYHEVYLVVRNMRENPFYVFPDQIVIEETEASA